MMDTEGSEVHLNEIPQPIKAEVPFWSHTMCSKADCTQLARLMYVIPKAAGVCMNDHRVVMQANDEYIFTIRNPANVQGKVAIGVSYEAFVDDVQVSS